jgi:alpha-N-arabinofuranosidase
MLKVKNPIIKGFYPDPSVCRVGEDYYLVNSTFNYFPGVPIFHSKDLAHWHQIGNILEREEQLDVSADTGTGIYAPTIRYHKGTYYMITTNMYKGGNFIVTATDPAGPWSAPYFLGEKEAPGFDPSLFFDDDGKCYYVGTRPNPETYRYNGDMEIWVQEVDLETMKLTGESMAIWKGALKHAIWPEGPHLYKKDGYYYLLEAEGGTGPGHRVTVSRSKELFGNYEPCPYNPIMRQEDPDAAIQRCGHGDLVETQDGRWYMVYLCGRTVGDGYSILGRETALDPVTWTADGWPIVNNLKGPSAMQVKPFEDGINNAQIGTSGCGLPFV